MFQSCFFEFLPESSYIDREGVVINKEITVPQFLHQIIPSHYTSSLLKQDAKDLKLILGQIDHFSLVDQIHGFEIEDSTPVF